MLIVQNELLRDGYTTIATKNVFHGECCDVIICEKQVDDSTSDSDRLVQDWYL